MSSEFLDFETPISLLKYISKYSFEYGIYGDSTIKIEIQNTDGTFSIVETPVVDAFESISEGSALGPGRHILEQMWPHVSNWFAVDFQKELAELFPKIMDGSCTESMIDAAIERFTVSCNEKIRPLFLQIIGNGNTLSDLTGENSGGELLKFEKFVKFLKKF